MTGLERIEARWEPCHGVWNDHAQIIYHAGCCHLRYGEKVKVEAEENAPDDIRLLLNVAKAAEEYLALSTYDVDPTNANQRWVASATELGSALADLEKAR